MLLPTLRRAPAALLAAALLFASTPACAAPDPGGDPAAPAQAREIAFVDVDVIPMDRERILEGQTVIVRDGRIARMGPSASVRAPAGALVVDGRGKYLMPGLSEMHAHIPSPQGGEAAIDRTLFLYLAGGVTTIRGMLGHPRHLELRTQAERGEILSPRIVTSGPSLNGTSAPTAEAARRMVEEQKAAGYDFLKLHPGLSRAAFDAMDEAADRAGIPFSGHVSADVGLRRALAAKYASIDHLDGYVEALTGRDTWNPEESGLFGVRLGNEIREEGMAELAAATRAGGVWNVPTQTLMEHLTSPEDPEAMARRPEMRYMPPATVAQWVQAKRDFQRQSGFTPEGAERYIQARRRLIKALHDAGAGLLLGSDAPQQWNVPGFSVARELRFLVDAGLTPYQALETGTRNPAVFLDVEDEWGTVAEGRAADLILLDSNPLRDIAAVSDPAGVMVRGRWLPRADIRNRLDAIAAEVR
jgi:imidazolonepropionase-like amidohydrolase